MPRKNENDKCTIIPVTVCFECPLSYADNGATWCSHPDGPKPPVFRTELFHDCPLRRAPAIVMLKEEADDLKAMLDRVGANLSRRITE